MLFSSSEHIQIQVTKFQKIYSWFVIQRPIFQLRTYECPSPPYLGCPGNQTYSLRNYVVFLKNLEASGEVHSHTSLSLSVFHTSPALLIIYAAE
jgi:hypothetical protein